MPTSESTSKQAKKKSKPNTRAETPNKDVVGSRGEASATDRGRGVDEADTGTPDETYGLVSVLYHALQGAETYEIYIEDAEAAGDDELVEFFRGIMEEERGRADRAKHLLAQRLGESTGMEDEDDSEDDDSSGDDGEDVDDDN